MMVLAIVGMPASGKGEFSRVAREMGIPVVVMGDAIRRAVREAGQPLTDENLGRMGNTLRAERGRDAVARACIPVIESLGAPLVVVDGVRSEAEVHAFRQHFPRFCLIGIRASFPTRLRRLHGRRRSDDSALAEDLARRDERERGWGLDRALEEADYTLHNEDDIGKFQRNVQELLVRLAGEAG